VNTTNGIDGKHDITGDVKKIEAKKQHLKAEKIKQSDIIDTPATATENVIF